MPRHPGGLPRPGAPEALRDALLTRLTDDQRARLSVVILDVSSGP
ncbi:hypothetical protein C882_0667 [Caenispirillum salinarum AK4]|uniref:Uncharacterized protein n=1 Tax=Caenispirillum salinarum AK4 TaxID=1238182 RepID=K9GVX0_9PROT|nr:hypothetical protein [Caenispirillum salinarum]EKV28904.1 hypothetical protein C882_0667 [Caenispirillum salinarum AK4]